MLLFKKICNFFKSLFDKKVDVEAVLEEKTKSLSLIDDSLNVVSENDLNDSKVEYDDEEKIDVSKRTLITKLYVLEQEIEVFRFDFPEKFASFRDEIKCIKDSYNFSAEEINKKITFEIDPELNSKILSEVDQLEKQIKRFINSEVKFFVLSNKLQRLAMKLNILYNVSISHFQKSDKEKVISQLEHAKLSVRFIIQELEESDYILNDKRFKDRIITLISFVDYEIIKTRIRNSNENPGIVINSGISKTEFTKFDYFEAIKSFILDEVSDLGELLPMLKNDEYCKSFETRISKVFRKIAYSTNFQSVIIDNDFWNEFLEIESNLIEMLKLDGISKEKAKVKILDKLDIQVNESEVLTLPKTNAYLALTNVFSKTQDIKILLLIKLFNNLTERITYKEIYFLLLLFDSLNTITNVSNELLKYIEKYIKKYPYDNKTIQKKKGVLANQSSHKEYLKVFDINDNDNAIISTLKELNLDFKIVDNNVYINSFYFYGLENVYNGLKAYTTNATI